MQPSFDNPDVGTSSVTSGTAAELPSAQFVWFLRVICAAALGISLYLAWTAFSMGNVFGCSGGEVFDCGHVLTSHWSKVMGIPVSVPAAGLYASLIALLAFARRSGPDSLRQLVWGGMTLGSVMAALAAVWFIGLQVFVLPHYCTYCLIVHTCGIVLAGTVLASRFCSPSLKLKSVGISLLSVLTLIGIQIATPKADQFEIVHYDDVVPAAQNDEIVTAESGEMEPFAAPGDVFAPPSEAFAPPTEAFEPPVAGGIAAEPDPAAEAPAAGSKDSQSEKASPSVASTLLLITPPRLLQLTHFLFLSVAQSGDETEAASDTAATKAEKIEAEELPVAEPPKPPERRLLTFAGNRFTLDIKQWPLLGKTDAKYVFVEMFDYTCPHCRNTHHAITGAQKQYGDDLAIFALPVPLERGCNPAATGGGHPGACEMAKIAVAVWRLDPSKFQTFHDWMFQGQRTEFSARAFAETLIDKERLKAELSSTVPSDYISRHVTLYQKVGSGQVPKIIFPKTTLQGEINSTATLCNAIKRELGP